MKKVIPLIIAMLILTSCSSMLNGSQDYSTPHESSSDNVSRPVYVDVTSYYDLQQAILNMVTNHESEGTIRFSSYIGNVEQDLNNVCIYIPNDTAIGSYAVSYVGSSLNRIVGYYEATISIIYKRDASETNNILSVNSDDELETIINTMMSQCSQSVAVQTSSFSINQDSFTKIMNKLYYSNPQLIVTLPMMDIVEYSDANGSNRIYEVAMTYPDSPSVMVGKKNAFNTILEQISFQLNNTENKVQLLYQLCSYLSDTVTYSDTVPDEEYDRFDSVNTAYGALYERKASGEGFAMAMKLLCDWQDIDCIVVTGRYNNYIHSWNIIKIEDDWYHFDVSNLSNSVFRSLMRTDRQMSGNYSWDTNSYPECSGSLNYTYLIDSGNSEQPSAAPETDSNSTEPSGDNSGTGVTD